MKRKAVVTDLSDLYPKSLKTESGSSQEEEGESDEDSTVVAKKILQQITIPFMESVVPSTTTYQVNEKLRLNKHMLNVLSNMDPLRHIPTVVLSLIGQYCLRVHGECAWMLKKTLNNNGESRPPRPSEQALLQIQSQTELSSQIVQWNNYFKYRVVPPSPTNFELFKTIVFKYIQGNYTFGKGIPMRILGKLRVVDIVNKCWSELIKSTDEHDGITVWLDARYIVEMAQYRAVRRTYAPEPRWRSGYIWFMAEEHKLHNKETRQQRLHSIAKKWKLLDKSTQDSWQLKAQERNQQSIDNQLKKWIVTMDQLEIEFNEWSYCWSNPDARL